MLLRLLSFALHESAKFIFFACSYVFSVIQCICEKDSQQLWEDSDLKLFWSRDKAEAEPEVMRAKKTERNYQPIASLRELAEKTALRGDKVLFRRFDRQKNLEDITYQDFGLMIRRAAAGLAESGLAGKRVAVIGETSPEWVASYLAAVILGGVAIPLDKDLQISEMKAFLLAAGADAIVYSHSFNKKFNQLLFDDELSMTFIPLEKPDNQNGAILPWEELMLRGKKRIREGFGYPELDDELDRFSVLLFTSGTMGTSKGVMLSERNVITSVNAACETVEFSPDDTIVSVLPIHHTYELCCMLAGINYGMTICINDSLLNVSKNIALFQPTGIVLVPAFIKHMYKKVLSTAEKQGSAGRLNTAVKASHTLRKVGIDMREVLFREIRAGFGGRLVKIVSGGAPLDPEIAARFADFGITICEGYGITECSPLVSVNPYYALKSGSVGTAVPGCEVRIEGDTQNNKGYLEGEIMVKGNNVMLGYYGMNADSPIENGWFHTGDVGYIDKDGYIFITGRKKSVIISDNGKNVSPEELEEYLYKLDEVLECVVIGRKNGEYNRVAITAVIYPDRKKFENDEEALEFFHEAVKKINDRLPAYKKIQQIELRENEFEKTTSRKIKRFLVS